MSALIISRVRIKDAAIMETYFAEAPATVASHGGEYVTRTMDVTPLEGDWAHDRVVVVRFPTIEAAKTWYESEDYRELRTRRQSASNAQIIVVPEG
jgi:uncharacterized protein (DUF1330 family)